MQLRTAAEAPVHRAPGAHSPTVSVYFGGDQDSEDIGLVRVSVPAGAGMTPHQHYGSDVILVPTAGQVIITREGGQEIEVTVGDAALIGRDESVALTNPGPQEAQLVVAAGPTDFVTGIRSWPTPGEG